MPTSLTIGAFVLGGVLLLISILRGGFKLFGAEVNSHAGSGGRLIAFVIGIVLLVTAFVTNGPARPDPGTAPDNSASASSAPAPVESAVQPAGTPSTVRSDVAETDEADDVQRYDAAVQIEWRAADEDLKQVFSAISNEQRVALGMAALMMQKDIYGISVRITNTGNVALNVAPEYLRLTYNGVNVPLTTAPQDARFFQSAQLQPNEYVQGLLMYEAALVGGNAVAAGGLLSYVDPRVHVSFAR